MCERERETERETVGDRHVFSVGVGVVVVAATDGAAVVAAILGFLVVLLLVKEEAVERTPDAGPRSQWSSSPRVTVETSTAPAKGSTDVVVWCVACLVAVRGWKK